jgi:glutaredoxin 2
MSNSLTIVSYNVQVLGKGLARACKRHELRDFMLNAHPKPNVILLQEHRMDLQECSTRSPQLNFLKKAVLCNEAIYSAHEDSLAGGTTILLSKKVADSICQHGNIAQGRAQYRTFMLTPKVKVGVLNIYGFNHTGP